MRPVSYTHLDVYKRQQYAGQIEALHRAVALDAPAVRKDLLALPSVGPETADAILLYALDAPAVVVDEYLRRITCLLYTSRCRYVEPLPAGRRSKRNADASHSVVIVAFRAFITRSPLVATRLPPHPPPP